MSTGTWVICGAYASFAVAVFIGLLLNGTLRNCGLTEWVDMRVTETNGGRRFSGSFKFLHSQPWGFRFEDMPDLTGRTAIVTGANSGLGLKTATHLARHGATVIMACRSTEKCAAAAELVGHNLTQTEDKRKPPPPVPGGRAIPMLLDLASFSSVRRFAEAVVEDGHLAVDYLILNAGVSSHHYQLSSDGIELQWAVNHVGHHLLFRLLTPQLLAAAEARGRATVTVVASGRHFWSSGLPLTMAAVNNETGYTQLGRYAETKLANVLFAMGAQEQLAGRAVFVNSVHPGVVDTEFIYGFRDKVEAVLGPGFGEPVIRLARFGLKGVAWTPGAAALTPLFTAVSPNVSALGIRGKYFHPVARVVTPSPLVTEEAARDLWAFTEELLSKHISGLEV